MVYTPKQIRIFAVGFSLFLSLFVFLTDDIINRDGILYLNMAQAYLDGGLSAATQLFDWPFFPILIAYIHTLSSLSIENSAFLLNGLLFALFIDTFLAISNKLLINSRQLIIATVLILCFSILNEYRDYIVRGIGYWAFCSLTVYRFIVFIEKPTIKNASLWQVVAIIAILFRVEGIVILLGLPLYLFTLHSPKQAFKHYIQLNFLSFIGILLAGFIFAGMGGHYGAFHSNIALLNYEVYLTTLSHNMNIMETHILNSFSENYSGLILISGLLVMLVYKLTKGLSLLYLGLYVASYWKNKPQQNASNTHTYLILYFTILSIAVLVAFLLSRYFISTRYCMMALIGLLLLMLPRICSTVESLWLARNKTFLSFIGLFLVVSLIDGVTSSRSKSYIKNTAVWASENIVENSTILTDNEFIEYYFNTHSPKASITKNILDVTSTYNYLIVIEKRKNQELKNKLSQMNIEPVFTDSNKRDDRATVYKVLP